MNLLLPWKRYLRKTLPCLELTKRKQFISKQVKPLRDFVRQRTRFIVVVSNWNDCHTNCQQKFEQILVKLSYVVQILTCRAENVSSEAKIELKSIGILFWFCPKRPHLSCLVWGLFCPLLRPACTLGCRPSGNNKFVHVSPALKLFFDWLNI